SSDALRKALQALVERHEALRGSFTPDGESFLISKRVDATLKELDMSHLPSAQRDQEYDAIKQGEVTRAFDLVHGPLYRVTLVRVAGESYRFLFSAHHVVCDGWSAGILMIELAALYRAVLSSGDARAAGLSPATSFTD